MAEDPNRTTTSQGGYLVPAALAAAWHKIATEPPPMIKEALTWPVQTRNHRRPAMNDREEHMGSTDDPSVLARQSYLEQVREGIRGLALYVVVGEGDDARDVRNRNRMDRPRLLDAVLLDDLWDLLEALDKVAVDE